MMKQRVKSAAHVTEPVVLGTEQYQQLVGLWCLRLLVEGKGYKHFVYHNSFVDDDILAAIGLSEYSDRRIHPPAARSLLKKQLACYEKNSRKKKGYLFSNIDCLGQELALSELEQEILGLLCLLDQSASLEQTFELFGHTSERALWISLIAVALSRPRTLVDQALSNHANLVQSGLICDADEQARPMYGLAGMMIYETIESETFLQRFCAKGSATSLSKKDFFHLRDDYWRFSTYLKAAIQRGTAGVNILLYGEPGSGKTEMVRVLAKELGLDLYDVGNRTREGNSIKRSERMGEYQLCQSLLRKVKKSVVLFDEIEDAFFDGNGATSKSWVNEMLERNPRPAFWVSNDLSGMDEAFIRRFDLALKMPALTTGARKAIAQQHLQGLPVSDQWLDQLAQRPEVQPGHLASVAKVVRHLRLRAPKRVEAECDAILSGTYQAMGIQMSVAEPEERTGHAAKTFDPALSNTDQPLDELVKGISKSQMGRICLYGPPGTGKSEMARFLADATGKALITKSGASLLGAYVGESEKLIAEAFAQARQQDAVLLIDEADSLLFSREGASKSWELSQVNELLIQMERFDGIFIASTNYMGKLDAASQRRFDLKIRFDYLQKDQVERLFRLSLGQGVKIDNQQLCTLTRLGSITPGDFATVVRRNRVLAKDLTADRLLAGLMAEIEGREGLQGRPIGFIR